MNIDYKGFTIKTFDSETHQRFHVMKLDCGFRDDGYPTLNHAKGAITNYLKAKAVDSGATHAEAVEDMKATLLPVKATKPVIQSRNKREGYLDGKRAGRMQRGLRMGKPLMLWSRNYTETLNRQQRKQLKMLVREHGHPAAYN